MSPTIEKSTLIGRSVPKPDAPDKAIGRTRYINDLVLPRMLIGVGESVLTPASMSMLADRFPAARLGLASGIYYMGVPIGIGASLLIVGYLEPVLGWRSCFYMLGGLGIAHLLGFMLPALTRCSCSSSSSFRSAYFMSNMKRALPPA